VFSAAWTLALVASLQAAPPATDRAPSPAAAQTTAAAPWPDDKPFERLLTNLLEDARALGTSDTGFLLAGGTASTLLMQPADDRAAAWADQAGESSLASFGRGLGDAWTQAGAAVGTYVIGRVGHHAQMTHIGSDLIRGQVLNGALTRATKLVIGRRRPSGGGQAFPSGHASATFTTAAILQSHYGWSVGIPAYAAAGFVGWSSVRTRAHWVTDVAAGATLGTIVGYAVTRGHRARDWQVVPIGSRDAWGILIFVNW
jgi:membrane-associated phospholipid phosphatase